MTHLSKPWVAATLIALVGCGQTDSLGSDGAGQNIGEGGSSGEGSVSSGGMGEAGGSVGGFAGRAPGSGGVEVGSGGASGGAAAGAPPFGGAAQGGAFGGAGMSQGGAAGAAGASTVGDAYSPCASKKCGDSCSLCAPDDTGCFETADLKYCDAAGTCMGGAAPSCGSDACQSASDCPRSLAPCVQCADGSFACPEAVCDSGQCSVTFPDCKQPVGQCATDADCAAIAAPCVLCPNGMPACPEASCVAGECVTEFPTCSVAGSIGCLVEGKEYPSGSTGVPDPYSCNTCTCENGQLVSCTEALCPSSCPVGTEPGSRCAQCGPAGGCLVNEIGCLDSCSNANQCGLGHGCLDGVCKMFCL